MDNREEHGQFFITQDIFLFNDRGEMLALDHFSGGGWLLPGGHINKDEDWRSALLREIEEETGITEVKDVELFSVDNWKNDEGFQYGVFFTGKTSSEEIGLSDEHVDHKWLKELCEVEELGWWCESLKERAISAWKKMHHV